MQCPALRGGRAAEVVGVRPGCERGLLAWQLQFICEILVQVHMCMCIIYSVSDVEVVSVFFGHILEL